MRIVSFLLLLAVAGYLPAQAPSGFAGDRGPAERELEELFLSLPGSETFREHLRALTREPHRAGSPENNRVADYMVTAMERAGLAVERFPYDIYMPAGPGEASIELVTPIRQPLNNKEYILNDDPFSKDTRITQGWNSYSGSGDVTAEVVYVNYGTLEDFEKLSELGVSVKGKIAIARYGGNFRGYKAKYAEAAGAAGLIIFSDPMDVGYMKGLPYPEGPFFNESTIQRGSVLTLDYAGDPLTPFTPALPLDGSRKVERLDPAEVPFHTIPVAPVPYGSAREILSRMKGQPVPAGWQGGLPFTYRVDGGEQLTVRLRVDQPKDFVRVQNVVGTIEGSTHPDEWIIIGCHFDAWEFGATDPNSGTAMLLTLADALGEMARRGQRPARTIKIAHWDAEEHGILGSTEWVEQFREELDQKAIAYFNADGACSGMTFRGASSPSLKDLLLSAAREVDYPSEGNITVYDHWLERARDKEAGPSIGNLGGGSDHLAFYAHVGIPSLGAGMGGPTMYHSGYDNFHWYSTVGEPNFVAGPTVAKVFGVMALRLANADVLPLDVTRYGQDLQGHLKNAEKRIQQYHPSFSAQSLIDLAARLETLGSEVSTLIEQKLAAGNLSAKKKQQVNQVLLRLERSFIDEEGMAYGKWYRSLYASSDPYSGYASWMLPGLLYEASRQSTENLDQLQRRYRQAFERLEQQLLKLEQLLTR